MDKMSKEQKSCECHTCVSACAYKPGWFMPGEAEKAAKLMKMSLKKFFNNYLGVDWWNGETYGAETFILSPVTVSTEPGEIFEKNPTGVCIFYKDNRCRIHAAKPYECQMYWHGDTGGSARHKKVAMAWKKHQAQIEKLLGCKPIAPELTIGDMIGFMSGMLADRVRE